MCGALVGTVITFLYLVLFVIPLWGPQSLKGDGRMENVCFVASTVLPSSVVIGIGIACVWLRRISFRLTYRRILLSCVLLWVLITSMTPVVDRVRGRGGQIPAYETIPNLMGAAVIILFASTCVLALIQYISRQRKTA